jgi:hypothetical protein
MPARAGPAEHRASDAGLPRRQGGSRGGRLGFAVKRVGRCHDAAPSSCQGGRMAKKKDKKKDKKKKKGKKK